MHRNITITWCPMFQKTKLLFIFELPKKSCLGCNHVWKQTPGHVLNIQTEKKGLSSYSICFISKCEIKCLENSEKIQAPDGIWGSDFFRVLQTFNLSCVCCFIFKMWNQYRNIKKNVCFTALLFENLPSILRVRFLKKIQDWILKSERMRKTELSFFTKQINPRSLRA